MGVGEKIGKVWSDLVFCFSGVLEFSVLERIEKDMELGLVVLNERV